MARSTFFHDLSLLPGLRVRGLLRMLVFLLRPLVEVRSPQRLEALPRPAIFAFNHNNAFEALAVPALLIYLRRGRLIHFFVDWMYLRIPLVGWLLRQGQPIPVFTKKARWDLWRGYRRTQLHRRPVAEAVERLRAGNCVGIFPEGARNGRLDRLRRGRLGLGELILGADAPVVPVGIRFTARHRLGRTPVAGRIRLVIGEPMDFEEERSAGRRGLPGGAPAPPSPGGGSRDDPSYAERRRRVVDCVMEALAPLSSKSYPYQRPVYGRPLHRQPGVRGQSPADARAALSADRPEVP